MRIRGIIATDLDGTLLTTGKLLTERTVRALGKAAQAGWLIVPATGRFHSAMPEALRALPFIRYAITVNGAQVYDIAGQKTLYRAEMPGEQAVAILQRLRREDVIYDCYMDGWGYIEKDMASRAADYNPDSFYHEMVLHFRTYVDDLCAAILERGSTVQKIQAFTRDQTLRARLLNTLGDEFSDIVISSAVPCNVEVNHANANKGCALMELARLLGVPRENTYAFGDGVNDLSMLRMAGAGIAMANAHPSVLAAADEATLSCDEEGVAARVERLLEECK